jgi:glyoxalase family protein
MQTGSLGIHHVTAICGDPQRNLEFYAGTLGLRLVKQTVNFDDPHTYHFYYGDETGRPGSLLTFFPWPGARSGRIGTGQLALTAFAIVPEALGFWIERLVQHNVKFGGPMRHGDEQVLTFRDPDGLMLAIVAGRSARERTGWSRAGIAAEQALRGLHSVTLWLEDGTPTAKLLEDGLAFRAAGETEEAARFSAGDGGAGALVDIRTVGGFPRGVGGVGTVHHVAFRLSDESTQLAIRQRLTDAGFHPTAVIDRQYFRSVYFREPGGVLFELATDLPGFAIDEPADRLGEQLMLPPQFEANRSSIEAALPEIHPPKRSVTREA